MARREARNFLVLGGKQIIFVLKNSRKSSQVTQETDTSIQQVSVSASEQANKANNLSVICSADKHFISVRHHHLHVVCPRRPKLRRYLAAQHKRRDAVASPASGCGLLKRSLRVVGSLTANHSFFNVSTLQDLSEIPESESPNLYRFLQVLESRAYSRPAGPPH